MDWPTRINDLLAVKFTVDSIAQEMGVTPNAVREIIAGRTKAPTGMAAVSLHRLHELHAKPRRRRKRAA